MEEEEIEIPVVKESTKEATKMETEEVSTDGIPPSTTDSDVNMQDGAENGVPESGDKPVQMETDAKVRKPCLK